MSINKIGINTSPQIYSKVYKGQYNGIRFNITYNKLFENDYGETDYSIEIDWIDFLETDRQSVVNDAIKKLFNSKIEQGLIVKD
tara:strand:+ start:556 stop:807 length:252 start_codon:yes stop_codon:yes gene_type:complete